jgi:cell division septum initiation protein DivIVA
MDPEMIDRLREPGFATRLWGYDREQVDALLADLERLLRGAQSSAAPELAGVGERVEAILAAAGEAADHVREEASRQAAEADQYASRLRAEAEREAEQRRRQAGAEAEDAIAGAEEEAERILREAMVERRAIEDSIADLRERRELVVQSIERLRGSLGSMVGEAELGTTEMAAAAVVDEEGEEGETLEQEPETYETRNDGEGDGRAG